jgi:SAM-dependent methyltransferase
MNPGVDQPPASRPAVARVRQLSAERGVSMGEEWFEMATPGHFWMTRRFEVLRKLSGHRLRGQPRCAEIGCGNGVLQAQAESAFNLAVDGFDLHRGALERNLATRGQLHYYDITERQPEFRQAYDVLFLFDVLEHIEDEDEFIAACRFHLRPGGALLINVPARRELFSAYDLAAGHVRRYTPRSLRQVAARTGMRMAECTYWGLPLYPLLWLRRFLVRPGNDARVLQAGFSPRTSALNTVLSWLARAEPVPQRFLGTSILAVFENPAP